MRFIRTWQVPKIWEGGEVWILGGGPSLLECFEIPNDVVTSVRFRKQGIETYSPFLAAIHDKHVIGVNVAYQFGSWVDMCFFGDIGFFLQHRPALSNYRKLIVTCCKKVGEKNLQWIKYIPSEQNNGISANPERVKWNTNSGAAAVNIAALAGAKRIILVGFDMTLSPVNSEQHFHNEYRQVGTKLKPKMLPFPVHLQPWEAIKKDADNLGIEILNTSLNSAIKEIPKVHIKELL